MAVYKTMQRETLLKYLGSHTKDAFTIRELSAELAKSDAGGSVPSESTVYRLMRDLEKDGKVHRSINPDNREYVYSIVDKNDHNVNMRCKVCGNVYSVDSETSRKIKEDIAGCGEIASDEEIELVGKCRHCRN